ncbi:MAG: hypothetical protein K0R24_1435 [Gammaproteobacteria bacterium]|jgi:uncharacterized protein YecE (DUF72 family)|nr:hypothetical protein [Gammaproteobacteria bacterium]
MTTSLKEKALCYIGTSGWNYPEWRGTFYPPKLAQRHWLTFYAEHFSTVEINATFYRFFADKVYVKWRESVPAGFKYIVKVPRLVTHQHYLKNSQSIIQTFCHSAELLQDKLGLYLLQLPPTMPYQPEVLYQTIMAFNTPKKVVVEFRHPQWFSAEIYQLLKEIGCILCETDSPQSQLSSKLSHTSLAETAYLRLHGRTAWYDYTYAQNELNEITSYMNALFSQGTKAIYLFFNNTFRGQAIHNAITVKKMTALNNVTNHKKV